MADPIIRCDWCARERRVLLHHRAEHPPTAAKRWLRKTCRTPKEHDPNCCSGCTIYVKPCEFVYRAGVDVAGLSRQLEHGDRPGRQESQVDIAADRGGAPDGERGGGGAPEHDR